MGKELLKELKDVGFPLHEIHTPAYEDRENARQGCMMCGFPFVEIDGKTYTMPLLEELIEACGNVILFDVGDGWVAAVNFVEKNSYGGHYIDGNIERPQNGATPAEAVARLWLALNKK